LSGEGAGKRGRIAPDLGRRVLTAIVVLPGLLAAILLGPPLLCAGIVGLATLLGLIECFRLLEARGLHPLRGAGLALAAVLFLETAHARWAGPRTWPLVAMLFLVAMLARRAEFALTVPSAAATLLAATYLGALGGSLAGLRLLDPIEAGPARLMLLLAIVMGTDVASFFVGYAIGRRKLAPRLSPKKTLEGALGGLVGGVLGALAVRWGGLGAMPLAHAVALGLLGSALGQTGDLFESLLKRWAGVKDSGTLFPGHGGMLDRLDSLLFGAPLLYYYFWWWTR
jgi:phosphatidate cytidylyltransferase